MTAVFLSGERAASTDFGDHFTGVYSSTSPLLYAINIYSFLHMFIVPQSDFIIFFNVYLFLTERERERQSMSGGGAEREGDTESEAGSRLRAVSTEPDTGPEPTNCELMT